MDGNHKPSVKIDGTLLYITKVIGTRNKILPANKHLNGKKHQKTYLDVFSSNKRMILTKSIENLSTGRLTNGT